MFKAFSKWYDKLWDEKHPETDRSAMETLVESHVHCSNLNQPVSLALMTTDHLQSAICSLLTGVKDPIILLVCKTVWAHRFTEEQTTVEDKWLIRKVDEQFLAYKLNGSAMPFSIPVDTHWIKNNINYGYRDNYPEDKALHRAFELTQFKYDNHIKRKAISQAKASMNNNAPGTAKPLYKNKYPVAISTKEDSIVYVKVNRDGSQETIELETWYVDVLLSLDILELDTDNKDYIIICYDLVDRQLIDRKDFRRWVVVKELADAKSPWVIRYVPNDIARGKIRYFSMDIDFDSHDLGGVSFDIPQMLKAAHDAVVERADKQLLGTSSVYAYHGTLPLRGDNKMVMPNSTTKLNADNINVTYDNINVKLKGYMLLQTKNPAFHDKNPYFNPSAPGREIGDTEINFLDNGEMTIRSLAEVWLDR